MFPLSENVKITKIKAYQAANTTTITSDEVDMEGFEGVIFIADGGTAAANTGIKGRQDTATGMGTADDLEGTSNLSDATQTDMVLDIFRPQERFLDCQVLRGTSTTIEAVWAIQYGAKKAPVDNETTAQAYELHVSPDEGTA